jgi:molybdenum cofactor synthesis domain-containing protein
MPLRIAILTVSDSRARGGAAPDASGDAIAAWAEARGDRVAARTLVADDAVAIAAQLARWCDADDADVVLTTGGTGLAPRDVTPEATRAVLTREAPGIAERIRAAGAAFPRAALSRGLAGTRAATLIVNLPGSRSGVGDALTMLEPIVRHAVDVLRDRPTDHSPGATSHAAPEGAS